MITLDFSILTSMETLIWTCSCDYYFSGDDCFSPFYHYHYYSYYNYDFCFVFHLYYYWCSYPYSYFCFCFY